MSVIREIHDQPEWVRLTLFFLCCATVLSAAGYLWLTGFERSIILTANPGEEGQARLAALQEQRGPSPLARLGGGLGSAAASIGRFIGFDREAGFDNGSRNGDNQDRPYLLPLSE